MRSNHESSRPPNFTIARLLIQQRCLGTLAHELGNISSPVALVAEVLGAGATAPAAAAAGTLRLVAESLARATTLCRLLRGTVDQGALSPATIVDTSAWWTLAAPYVEDMLPDAAHADGNVVAVRLAMAHYQALIWTCMAIARFAAITRPALTNVRVTGMLDDADSTFALSMCAAAARTAVEPRGARQLLKLAAWETRRVGGRMRVSETDTSLDCRVILPLTSASPMSEIR